MQVGGFNKSRKRAKSDQRRRLECTCHLQVSCKLPIDAALLAAAIGARAHSGDFRSPCANISLAAGFEFSLVYSGPFSQTGVGGLSQALPELAGWQAGRQ